VGYLDGNYYFDTGKFTRDEDKTDDDVTYAIMIPRDAAVMAMGKADGHLLYFRRPTKKRLSDEKKNKRGVHDISTFANGAMFSHTPEQGGHEYDEKLEIILRPEVVHTHPVCVNVYLHIAVFAPHMLPSDKDMHGSGGANSMVFRGAEAFQQQFD
jgi:hypothetical protein